MATQGLPVPDTPIADQAVQLVPHGASVGALIAALMGWLPGIIAIIPAIYYGLLIYESKTVQRVIARRRAKKLARRIHAKRHGRKRRNWAPVVVGVFLVVMFLASVCIAARIVLDTL